MKKALLFVDNGTETRRVLLLKSDIKGHARHTAGGKVVFVNPHQDKRTKKQDAGKKPKGFKPGDIVKYSKPGKGEEHFRFRVKESHHDADPPRVQIEDHRNKGRIKPVETVHPDDITHGGGGSEDRSGWEDAVYQAIEATGITRSDAQGVVEAREELFDSLFEDGASPQEAAKAILAASQSAAKTSAK